MSDLSRGDELKFRERALPFVEKYRFASYTEFIHRLGSDAGLATTVVEDLLKEKYPEPTIEEPAKAEPEEKEEAK